MRLFQNFGLVDCFYKPVLNCSSVNLILINSQRIHGLELQFIQPTQLFSQHSMRKTIIYHIPFLTYLLRSCLPWHKWISHHTAIKLYITNIILALILGLVNRDGSTITILTHGGRIFRFIIFSIKPESMRTFRQYWCRELAVTQLS